MEYQLTSPQKRVCYVEQIHGNTPIHNIGGIAIVHDNLELDFLAEAIQVVINTHDALRLRLVNTNGAIKQHVTQQQQIIIPQLDFSNNSNSMASLHQWAQEEFNRPFNIFKDEPLYYFAVFNVDNKTSGYLIKLHHLIADGWSIDLLTKQICSTYIRVINNTVGEHKNDFSYIDYISSENAYIQSLKFHKDKEFWLEKLHPTPTITRTTDIKPNSKRISFQLTQEFTQKIQSFAHKKGFSLNMLFSAAMLLYLSKVRNSEDIIIGTPVLNRSGAKEKAVVGMFTSTMPFRMQIKSVMSVKDYLLAIKKEFRHCYFHQKYPYNLLVQDLGLKNHHIEPLFDICVNYYNTKLINSLLESPIDYLEYNSGQQLFSLQLVVHEWDGGINLNFNYKVADYTSQQIKRIYASLCYLLEQLIKQEKLLLCDLALVNREDEKHLIYNYNATSKVLKEKTITQLFEEQATSKPQKISIEYNGHEITYADLNQRADQIAAQIHQQQIAPTSNVAIIFNHSVEMVAAILGVLKTQCAYVPIDPNLPPERINYILKDSRATMILTNITELEIKFHGTIIDVNKQTSFALSESNNVKPAQLNNLAYLIYTSGSTGRPKGVMIKHSALTNYLQWARDVYVKNQEDVFALYSSLAFDLTVTSILVPLISGNKIVIYDDKTTEDEFVLYKILRDNKATIIKLTPAHLSMLTDKKVTNKSVRRLIVGGDKLPSSLCRQVHNNFGKAIDIYNEYGPTEATIGCMIYKYDIRNDITQAVPIGIPAYNTKIYVLNETLQPVPIGIAGEIYIGGASLAAGYLNKKTLTQEKFITNPYVPGEFIYKSGDSAKHLESGVIEYIGRLDRQIKLNGFRIEPGEIEQLLLKHQNITAAFVTDLTHKNGNKYLAAYITTQKVLVGDEIKQYLSRHLAANMVPAHVVILEKFPLTINGKPDLSALPRIDSYKRDEKITRQANAIEKILISSIMHLLDVDVINLGDNFFYLGGDSIKAIQLASKLKEMNLELRVKDILSLPIIQDMASTITETNNISNPNTSKKCFGKIASMPIAAWFFSQGLTNPNHYHQSIILHLKQNISLETITKALQTLIAHHDALRIKYDASSGNLYYAKTNKIDESEIISSINLSEYKAEQQEQLIKQHATQLKAKTNITKSVLFKACLFDLGQTSNKRLLLYAHHLIIDGVSWRILLRNLYVLIKGIQEELPMTLPPKTSSLQDWALCLQKYSNKKALVDYSYWKNILNSDFCFPVVKNSSNVLEKEKSTLISFLSKSETRILFKKANSAYNTKPNELLIMGLALALSIQTGKSETIIELEGHGRENIDDNIDMSQTVGWLTAIYPVKLIKQGNDFNKQIKSFKEQLRSIPAGGLSFGALKYLGSGFDRDYITQVRFNYLGEFDSSFNHELFEFGSEDSGIDIAPENRMTAVIDIVGMVINEKLKLILHYNNNKVSHIIAQSFFATYKTTLRKLLDYCSNKQESELTPTDFQMVDLTQTELDGIFDE